MPSLSINPSNLPTNVPMTVGETLDVTMAATCVWCYSDPDGVMSGLPAAGSYTLRNPPQLFTSPKAEKVGIVYFDAVTSGACSAGSGVEGTMAHRITVS